MGDSVASPPPVSASQQQSQHTGLPSISSLTNGLPPSSHQRSPELTSATDSTRDSGASWPMSQSKHNSANSGLQVHTLLNPDESPPHRNSQPATPLSARLPQSSQSGHHALPSINQGFQETGNRDSQASYDSRRSSVDSRMQLGFNGLYINNPQSPYESNNTSQVSLAASLRRPNGQAPMSPLSGRSGVRSHPVPPRVAPPIMPGRTPGQPDPTAAKPTQGYAWAFPDGPIPEERRGSDSGDSSTHGISRTNSLAASSIRSSIFSTDSHLPIGQRRFEEDQSTTHHHTMQHRTIQGLQHENLSASAIGNYSRTPELRVSHKLAERKRRSEMKDLFEELNKAVPSNGGAKASKWEILTKAIEYIRTTQSHERQLHSEVQRLQRDYDYSREAHKENELLKTEVQVMHQTLKRLDPNAPHVYGHFTSQLSQHQSQQQQQQQQPNGSSGMQLPPLNNPGPPSSRHESSAFGSGGGGGGGGGGGVGASQVPPPPPAAMQGVEYGGYGQAR